MDFLIRSVFTTHKLTSVSMMHYKIYLLVAETPFHSQSLGFDSIAGSGGEGGARRRSHQQCLGGIEELLMESHPRINYEVKKLQQQP